MPQEYSKEQLEQLIETLPPEIKEALASLESADIIREACSKYGIEDSRVSQVAEYAGLVLMGVLLPSEFPQKVKKITMPEVVADAISKEITRFLFLPFKHSIEALHEMKLEAKEEPEKVETVEQKQTLKIETNSEKKSSQGKRPGPDPYREMVDEK